ncbi:MAG: isoprenyl transferase [Pseudomonadota bacterium]
MDPLPAFRDMDIPTHVAIIMDGNGRWARGRGMPRIFGHQKGAEAVRRCVRGARELRIPYLTLFGFSSENWRRPVAEVEDLMGLLRRYLKSEVAELHKNGVRLRIVGQRERLPKDVVALIEESEKLTSGGTSLNLTIALSYGARQDIISASQSLARAARDGELDPGDIDESHFGGVLSTSALPDPDLLIRTSGEQRISNFLLWELAYAELVFVEKNWPDFSKEDLATAVREFQKRDRRYGATAESG